jgi:cell division protein FtsN
MFLLYGIIFPASFQEVYTDTANLANYFFSPLKNDKPLAVADEPAFELIEQAPDTETITEKSPEPAMSPEPLTAGSKDELPAKELSPKYYIIGGCFESGENAAQFMAELSGKGYDAEKAGTNKSGHVRISYRSFSDKKAALEYLSRIREEENQSAWLLKY